MERTPLPPILNPHDPLRPYTPPPKPKKNLLGKWKKPLWGLGLFLAFGFSLLVLIAAIMEEKVGAMVVKEVNRQLKTKLTVRDFGLSLITGFPKASANLEGVLLNDAFGKHVFKARAVALRFSLFNLFTDNISIDKIVVQDGIVVLLTDKQGRNNYDITKPTNPRSKSAGMNLSIEKAELRNVRFIYKNIPARQDMDLTIQKGRVSGNFSSKQFTLTSEAQAHVTHYTLEGKKYLEQKPLSYEADIAVDMTKSLYKLNPVSLNLASLPLTINGAIQLLPQGTGMNLSLKNQRGNLTQLLQLLPPQYASYFKDFASSGDFSMQATIKGISNKTLTPDVQAVVHFKNGRILSSKMKEPFTNVAFDAAFKSKSQVLDITNCQGTFAGSPFAMRLKYINFNDPTINFVADGALPLNLALGFIGNPDISEGSGKIICRKLQIAGKAAQLGNVKAIRASGDLTFENAALKIKGEPITTNGNLSFSNNDLILNQFTMQGLGSKAIFTGSFANWLPVLLGDKDEQTDLIFDARLDIDRLDVGKLVQLSKPKPQPVAPQSYYYAAKGMPIPKYRKQYSILNHLSGHLSTSIGQFKFDEINGRQFKGDLNFIGNDIKLRGVAQAMGGGWTMDGVMAMDFRPKLTAKLIADRVNITEFMRQAHNFGQSVLTNQHLSGTLNSKMSIQAVWDEGLNFLSDKLHVLADVNLTDGALVGFKMLEGFSNFIKIQDLRNVRFSNLNNQLEVYKRTIHIPMMYVRSNAINLSIAGTHTFDNSFNYNIMLNAGQILMNKFKIFNPRLDPQPDSRNTSLFNLYYTINGNFNNYAYKSDRAGVRQAFAESEQQGDWIRANLAKAFGNDYSTDTPLDNRPPQLEKPQTNPFEPNIPRQVNSLQPHPAQPKDKNKKRNNEDEYIPGF